MTINASDLYEQLKETRFQLEQLANSGRIVMTQDQYNPDHKESAGAITLALAGLDQALEAMVWMETLPPGERP